jgi:hypothetical protein
MLTSITSVDGQTTVTLTSGVVAEAPSRHIQSTMSSRTEMGSIMSKQP